jgi:hypothetical protein|tara:strand:- start:16 stop:261 length:246 start_codon:yes stop_codon:yes gene_type:complete
MKFINTKTTIATIDRELAAYKEGAQIMNHFLLIASDRIKEQKQTIAELEREVSDLKHSLEMVSIDSQSSLDITKRALEVAS